MSDHRAKDKVLGLYLTRVGRVVLACILVAVAVWPMGIQPQATQAAPVYAPQTPTPPTPPTPTPPPLAGDGKSPQSPHIGSNLARAGQAQQVSIEIPTVGTPSKAVQQMADIAPRLVSDGQFVYGRNMAGFDLETYLQTNAPHLLPHYDDLNAASLGQSINPRILLTMIEMRSGLVTNKSASLDQIENPFALPTVGMLEQLKQISIKMTDAFYYHYHQVTPLSITDRPALPVSLQDGNVINLSPDTNAGTYAVVSVIAEFSSYTEFEIAIENSNSHGFYQTYRKLFPDNDPLDESNQLPRPGEIVALAVPSLQLPFPVGESWKFNGAHTPNASTSTMASIDFSRDFPSPGSDTSDDWVVAAAPGTVKAAGPSGNRYCQILIWHNSDGSVRTTYYHLENRQVSNNQQVDANTHLANSANTYDEATTNCWGGSWTNPHVHFTLVYNGVYWPLDGVSLSGWTVHSGEYSGDCRSQIMWLERGGQRKYAWCPPTRYPGDSVLNDLAVGDTPQLTLALGNTLKNRVVTIDLGRTSGFGQLLPPIFTSSARTDADGNVTFTLSGVAPDTYNLFIKPHGYVRKKVNNTAITSGGNIFDFQALFSSTCNGQYNGCAGDINDDNKINCLDFVILVEDYYTSSERSDLTGDGFVNGLDAAKLIGGYFASGAVIPSSSGSSSSDAVSASSSQGELALTLSQGATQALSGLAQNNTFQVGEVFTLTLSFDTADQPMAGTDALIDYDHCVLELLEDQIVDSGVFSTTNSILRTGTLEYEADKFHGIDPTSPIAGTGFLAHIPFRAIASIPGSTIVAIRFKPNTRE